MRCQLNFEEKCLDFWVEKVRRFALLNFQNRPQNTLTFRTFSTWLRPHLQNMVKIVFLKLLDVTHVTQKGLFFNLTWAV